MTGITHKQAGRYMRKELDGLLTDTQRRDLQTHLDECEACRLESESFSLLTARLKNNFQARWDTQHGPSTNMMANVQSQTRRIIMKKRIDFAFNIFGGVVTLLVLVFVVNRVVSQFQKNTAAGNETQVVVSSQQGNDRLLAFTKEADGNFDVYTIRADGTDLTNLTNNPARDAHPIWSPDGKHIVFESDRAGITQIYLMDADGANVVQLTSDNVDHRLPLNYDSRYSLWSPDGSKFLFMQSDPGNETGVLNSMDIDGNNKTILASGMIPFGDVSWSPDGNYIGYVLNDSPDPNTFVPNIYIVDSNGSNPREIQKFLSEDESIFTPYFWLSGGHSVIFPANKNNPLRQTVYEFSLDNNTLNTIAAIKPMLFDWQDGIALIIDANKESQPLVWLRPDGTSTELEDAKGSDPGSCSIDKERSLPGNLLIGTYCNNQLQLYWINTDGSKIQQLPELNVQAVKYPFVGVTISPDEKFIAFNIEGDLETNLYIWNMGAALNDSSVQPIKAAVGNVPDTYSSSWQPIISNDIVEQMPTPEPTQTSSYDGIIAFTSQKNGNPEIYTMHADGSNVINITNNPAIDTSPAWSPDGKSIAFNSDRTDPYGNPDIFVMNPDGKDLKQLTDNPGWDEFLSWSPDGRKIVYLSNQRGHLSTEGQLIVMNPDGSNKIALTEETGSYSFLSWSPDGQKIVYQKYQLDPAINEQDAGIYIVGVDGTNQQILATELGAEKIQWQDSEHFLGVGFEQKPEEQPAWSIYRFITDGNLPLKLSSYSAPIVALFENTYVVERQDALMWYSLEGASTPLSSWKFAEICKTPGDPYIEETNHFISPDKKHSFVGVSCADGNGSSYFLLMNEDGTEIHQLGMPITNTDSLPGGIHWSPDGKYVIVPIASSEGGKTDLYLFDIEKKLNDPSTQPIQLTTDGAMNYGAVWQPVLNNAIVEEKPTPEPLTFSLTVNEAEAKAGFDVLEPSYLPAGYTLEGAAYDPQTQKVAMKYISQQSEGTLFIYQQRGNFVRDPAGQAYVTPMPIGDVEAEFIRGAWVYETPDTTIPRWDASADVYSLSWQKGGIVFSINFLGGETVPPLSAAELLSIGESLQ